MTTILPGAVQNASDYADALEQQLHGQAGPETTGGAGNSPQDNSPAAPAPSAQEVPDEAEKLRRKYSTLQGKYNAEVPALHQRVKELEAAMQQQMQANEALRKEIADTEAKKSYLTEQDDEAFGKDVVDLVRRGAREEGARFAKQAADMQTRLESMERQLRAEREASAQNRMNNFYASLSGLVPDWEAQNTDPKFLEWLDGSDTQYGPSRMASLQDAFNVYDVKRVAAIFLAFRNRNDPKRAGLARQVTPAHSRSANPPAPTEGVRSFTQQEIASFYDAWRRGEISDEDAARIEKQINAAVAAGLVTA